MKRRAMAITLALLAASGRASAQEAEPVAEAAPPMKPIRFVGRLGIAGAYRRLYDLDILGMGPEVSLGVETRSLMVLWNMRFIDARTADGLVVLETTLDATVEGKLAEGWHAGVGVGGTYLSVLRATSGGPLQSAGPMVLGRVTWDLDPRPNVYLAAELEGQLQASGAFPWGPTVEAGLRF